MSNQKYKVVYSLRMELALEKLGFKAVSVMPNPRIPAFNCWVYEETPAFLEAFDKFIREGDNKDGR